MDEMTARSLVVKMGKKLLEEKLVARTWGNASCRIDDHTYVITPSGLDYVTMTEEDIVSLDYRSGQCEGKHKPSSEKGVHTAAMEVYPEVNYVIHTHQLYATAIGIAGFDTLDITAKERQQLGGIALAKYGLPGTEVLTAAVRRALESGAQTVLMAHHGVLICGVDGEECLKRVRLLEEICSRNVCPKMPQNHMQGQSALGLQLQKELQTKYKCVSVYQSPTVVQLAEEGTEIPAQVDDMAQMIGAKIPCVAKEDVERALRESNTVLVKGIGAVLTADNADDVEALELLVEKAAFCRIYTKTAGVEVKLSDEDVEIMRKNYIDNYSRQKRQSL